MYFGEAFEALKSFLLQAPILGFPTEADRFVLDTEASLFEVGGVLPGGPGGGDRLRQSETLGQRSICRKIVVSTGI